MKLVESSIRSPVAVAVGVIIILLFGFLALFDIPIQLTPDVEKPRITVSTRWPGASPYEVEREIVDVQEEFLKNIEGLREMTSQSTPGSGSVVLEFAAGVDLAEKMLRVSNALDRVRRYPDLADKPVVTSVDQRSNAVAWFIVKTLPGNDRDVLSYRNLCRRRPASYSQALRDAASWLMVSWIKTPLPACRAGAVTLDISENRRFSRVSRLPSRS